MRKSVDHVNKRDSDPAGTVLDLVHSVMHLSRAQQFRALREAEHGVTHMESKVLGFFARHPGATPSELVAHSGRDKGQLARLIQGLRERGLLEARADTQDRRILRLQLTSQGDAALQAVRRQGRQLATVAVKGLTVDERTQLVALLARVQANLASLPSSD
ncbi:MAG TPA: MarR family winged helix-turn-helix transcriptional regulator [Ramlibacter sp.]|uniref:MarR family winged helix-turn-helix transcriptional regulator n=1 Tax=Ramlibacter sp. TaxID=1917967 RepID=UPI002D5744BD|nr:MarR family winged helix-turn-helix transcriptional regulator [Ramlibacter sp.]HZY18318.1 MarR family winged helix-turn-helix transcriptional regulator [Ramlibacter sp.]